MSNWKKWIWPGILTCAILSILALYMKSDIIEADLSKRATAALNQNGLTWAQVEMDGRDATIVGAAPSEAAQQTAADITLNSYDVRVVANQSELLALQSPYVLTAKRAGTSLELSGFVPDDQARANIVAAAKKAIPGSSVKDSLTLARGAPAEFSNLTAFGFDQLATLKAGEFSLSDTDFSIIGATETRDAYNTVNSNVAGALPAGTKLVISEITAPVEAPYTWSADFDGNTVKLEGFVPSIDAGETIKQSAQAALPDAKIEDNQLIASGQPGGFEDSVKFALNQLPNFSSGKVSLADTNLSVEGAANSVNSYESSIGAIAAGSLPAGLALASSDITPATVSPYNWSANYSDDKLALNGFVPDARTRVELNDKAKSVLPDAEIVDNMQVAAGAPNAFDTKAEYGLDQLSRFSSGSVNLADSNLSIKGVARDSALYDDAQTATDTLPDGLVLAGADIAPATVTPYTWSAQHDGKTVILSGYAPSTDARDSVNATLRKALPDYQVKDEMRIAAGAPERFLDSARFAANQLSRFSEGSVALSDRALAVSGIAKTSGGYVAARAALTGRLPANMTLASENISPPTVSPYIWGADYNGQTINLTGYVPDNETRDAIVATAGESVSGALVSDAMKIANGAPEGFGDAARFSTRQLGRFSSGSAQLNNLALSVRGTVKNAAVFEDAKAAVKGDLPAGMSLSSEEILSATASPYIWNAQLKDGAITLEGYVPDNATRRVVLASVAKAFPGAGVTDNMLIAAGAPNEFAKATGFSTKQLRRLNVGSVGLSDNAFTVRGTARDPQNYNVAKAIVNGTLPANMTLFAEEILPAPVAPYTWSAKTDGKVLTLTGYAPDNATSNAIAAYAAKSIPGAVVQNHMLIAAGAPETFADAIAFSTDQLSRLSSGSVGLNNLDMSVRGVANGTQNYVDAIDALEGELPAGISLADQDISPPTIDPYSWSANFDGSSVTLGGFVPSKDAKNRLKGEAAAKLPGVKVLDQMQIAAGAPDTHVDAAIAAINVLPRFSKGSVALSGLNLTVIGTGKSSANYLAAESYVAGSLAGGAKLVSADIEPPVRSGDYQWAARKTGNAVVLSGLAPTKQARLSIAKRAAVLNPGATVINRMTVESGAPKGFVTNTNKGMSLLDGLSEGNVSIKNQRLSISGKAKSVNAYEILLSNTSGDLNAEYSWGERTINPPKVSPFSWSVDNSGPEVVIGGFVPNRGLGNTNIAAAQAVLEKSVVDKQRVAGGAPDSFGNATASLIGSVDQLTNSRATLTGAHAFLQGRATSETEASRIGNEARANLPANYSLNKQISFPLPKPEPKPVIKAESKPEPEPAPKPVAETAKEPESAPKVCDVDFAALFDGQKIQFDTARAVIKPTSYNLLNRVAGGLKKCEGSQIEIGGHTDSRGSETYNQGLSEARARAVYDYMVKKAGVSASKLVAKGYGEADPIASNLTVVERTRNRRIEFKKINQN